MDRLDSWLALKWTRAMQFLLVHEILRSMCFFQNRMYKIRIYRFGYLETILRQVLLTLHIYLNLGMEQEELLKRLLWPQ